MEQPVFHLKQVMRTREPQLQDFHGPLDLILHLLSKHKVELGTLSLALIVEQYLEYLAQREEMNLYIASDFVAMAAHLVYLKTKLLLDTAEEELQEEVEALASSLEAHRQNELYEAVGQVAEDLALRYQTGADGLTKLPEPLMRAEPRYGADALTEAVLRLAERKRGRLPPPIEVFQALVKREPYPVDKKVHEVLQILAQRKQEPLWTFLCKSRNRSELVATFLAVLELCRQHDLLLLGQDGETATLYLAEGSGE